MSDKTTNSLVNFGDISQPANTLIKKISKAVGGLFAPYQIKRIAKAEAEAEILRADTAIQVTDLHRRAMHRFIEEEADRQQNMEDITSRALPQLSEDSDPEAVEDDWVTNFFEKSRIVSDGEMQDLWARVLAGEANSPGSYSKRTVNFLSDLDKTDAEIFSKLCGFGWQIGGVVPLVFDVHDDIYNRQGLNFGTISHLDSIGLIQFKDLTGFTRIGLPKHFAIAYYGAALQLEMPKESDNILELGHVVLTKTGRELAPICTSQPVVGFMEYAKTKWKEYLPKPVAQHPGAAEG
ncbi:MAG: DUF2806 domain-containing protein [Candidatus Nealsonbacteria bacterium]|nr:DUF2806 domain-containing protein [Candidatus Nealsonbacteria bacterium]